MTAKSLTLEVADRVTREMVLALLHQRWNRIWRFALMEIQGTFDLILDDFTSKKNALNGV